MWTNQKARKLLRANSLTDIIHLSALWALLRTEMTNLPTISFASTSEILTLSYTWGVKKVPFSGWASPHWSLEGQTNPQARQTIRDTKELGNRRLSDGDHFVSGDLKSFVKKPRSLYEASSASTKLFKSPETKWLPRDINLFWRFERLGSPQTFLAKLSRAQRCTVSKKIWLTLHQRNTVKPVLLQL